MAANPYLMKQELCVTYVFEFYGKKVNAPTIIVIDKSNSLMREFFFAKVTPEDVEKYLHHLYYKY